MRRLILLPCLALLLALNNSAYAQEVVDDTQEDSARPFAEKVAELKLILKGRDVQTREDLAVDPGLYEAFMHDRADFLKRLAAVRADCRADLRRANRDMLLSVTLECYRSDLTLQTEWLQTEASYVEQLKGLAPAMKQRVLDAIGTSADAMQTIIDAIDSDVYSDASQLVSAKRRLWEQYEDARYLAWGLMRADRLRGWIGLLALRLGQLPPPAEGEEASLDALNESIDCLTLLNDELGMFMASNSYEETKESFGQYQSSVKKCLETIRHAIDLSRGFSPEVKDPQNSSAEAGSGTGSTNR